MPLKALVKVSKVSNLSDARYSAGMGVEMLGFRVISGQEYYMPPEHFQDIRGWVSGPKIVAELYGVTTHDEIDFVMQTYAPDYFELSYTEYKTFQASLHLPCIVSVPLTDMRTTIITEDEGKVSYLLADEQTTCSDLPVKYSALIKISSLETLQEKLSANCFRGFVLEASAETRPGITNYDDLGEILEALDQD